MQVTATEDVAAPIDHVFAELTAFDALERQALRRGIDVRRNFRTAMPNIGEGWEAQFRFRGKERSAKIELEQYCATSLAVSGKSGGLETNTHIELVPLSPNARGEPWFKMAPGTSVGAFAGAILQAGAIQYQQEVQETHVAIRP